MVLNDTEQNAINVTDPFRMESDAKIKIVEWKDDLDFVLFCGEHYGFGGKNFDVIHRRTFYYDKVVEVLIINDFLHHLNSTNRIYAFTHMHLSQDLEPSVKNGLIRDVYIPGDNQDFLSIRILEPENSEVKIYDSWVSPSYGNRIASKSIAWTWQKQSMALIVRYKDADRESLDTRISDAMSRYDQLNNNATYS